MSHCPRYISLAVILFDGLALVVQLLAAAKANLYFGDAPFVEVDLQGNQRQPLFMGEASELDLLGAMDEQLARTLGNMVPDAGLRIFGNVSADQPNLSLFDTCVRFIQR